MKFAKKADKKVKKRSSSSFFWGIKQIETSYKFSVSGTLGPAKITAIPEIEMKYKNLGF